MRVSTSMVYCTVYGEPYCTIRISSSYLKSLNCCHRSRSHLSIHCIQSHRFPIPNISKFVWSQVRHPFRVSFCVRGCFIRSFFRLFHSFFFRRSFLHSFVRSLLLSVHAFFRSLVRAFVGSLVCSSHPSLLQAFECTTIHGGHAGAWFFEFRIQ